MSAAFRLAGGGRIDRAQAAALHASTARPMRAAPATRSPRRCSPTACIWSAARSSITGRAASCPPAPRSPTRWSTVDRGAGAHDAEPARHAGRALRRARRRQPEPLAVARASTSARSTTCSSPLFSAGFYYKTFMWPRALWKHVYEPTHPRRRRPRQRARRSPTRPLRRTATPIATCWWSAAARPASRRRSRRPRPARASSSCDEQAELGGSLLLRDRRHASTARPAGPGSQDALADARRAWPTSRCCRAPRRSATTPRISSAWSSGSPTISPTPIRDLPRERLWQVRAKRGRARHRRDRAAAGVRRTTTGRASCWPTPARTYLNRYGVRPGTRAVLVTANDVAYARGARPAAGRRRRSRCDRRPARPRRGAAVAPARARRHRGARRAHRARHAGPAARQRVDRRARSTPTASVASAAHSPAICVADVRRLDAGGASVLAVARQARLRRDARRPSCRARRRRRERSAGACTRHLSLSPLPGRRLRAPGRRRGEAPTRAHGVDRPARVASAEHRPAASLGALPHRRDAGRRPRPSSISRTTSPPRISASRCARASARSSTSSATPPPAWRPTRARPRT